MNIPNYSDLPPTDAKLRDIGRFSHQFDPTDHFLALGGSEYKKQVENLWEAQLISFREGGLPSGNVPELLLVLAYQLAIAPYTGAPDSFLLSFSHWLIEGMRKAL